MINGPSPQRSQLIAMTCSWGWHRTQCRCSLTLSVVSVRNQIMLRSSICGPASCLVAGR